MNRLPRPESGGSPAPAPPLSAHGRYRVMVVDQVHPALAGNAGTRYTSPPLTRKQALTLAGTLAGLTEPPDDHGPWQHPRPGGRRIVSLEPAP